MTLLPSILGFALLLVPAAQAASDRPNFLLILADDLGWRDVGFAGNEIIDTPHLDALARDGTVFTRAYASAPNCAPTRACLMTGQYPPRHGIYTVVDDRHRPGSAHHRILAAESQPELAPEAVTIGEVLRDGGYATGMVGMWNLGRGRRGPGTPSSQGFDFTRQAKELGFEKDAYHDEEGRYLTNAFADAGISFIEQSRGKPWFLYFAPHAVHAPFDPPKGLLEKYAGRSGAPDRAFDAAHAATVEALDAAIGRFLDKLKHSGMADRTFVIFTSDNGGTRQYVAPLRGGKGSLYEGGLRVPMVVRGPNVKPGFRCDTPVLSMDLYPTLAAAAEVPVPERHPVDGANLLPLLSDTGKLQRDTVYWHFPCYVGRNGPASVIRREDFKLIEHFESKSIELFNLADDPGESRDLSREQPDATRELLARLHAWHKAHSAPRPSTPNPNFDPSTKPPRGRDQLGKGEGRKRTHPKSTKPRTP